MEQPAADEPAAGEPASSIEFTEEASEDQTQVTVFSLAGGSFGVAVGDAVKLSELKVAIASKLGLDTREFRLVGDAVVPPSEDASIGELTKPEGVGANSLSLNLIKHCPLELYEERSLEEWREVARALREHEIEDDTVLERLTALLDRHPALVNLHSGYGPGQGDQKPLLLYATEGAQSLSSRQRCVDELLRRGARVAIRHESGFLVEQVRASGSVFADFLMGKCDVLADYESKAKAEWRVVSSKLCGETQRPVHDEEEMTRIVREFCEKHPEMVNFQSNHASAAHEKPLGYFGYAPLITFAGAQACRQRRGRADGDQLVRQGSVQELLRHGARLDMHHGKKTALEWMAQEGSLLLPWIEAQLLEPVPEQAAFSLSSEGGSSAAVP